MFIVDHEADECFVVFEKGIELRLMSLDEGVFKKKCLFFIGGNDDIDGSYFVREEWHHGPNILSKLKVLFKPLLEIFRFADIDHRANLIFHQIDAGLCRIFFQVKRIQVADPFAAEVLISLASARFF